MNNLIKQSFVHVKQAASVRPSKKDSKKEKSQHAHHKFKKKYISQRIKLKRLRERVYLSHFLSVNGIEPEHIICGEDDGKEPDFTLIINNQYIGIELTTLPRLRDRMGDKHLLQKRWYWKLRAKLTGLKKRLFKTCRVSWHKVFQHVHFYHSYDSHHDHFSHLQHDQHKHCQTHCHHKNQLNTTQDTQNNSTLKEKYFRKEHTSRTLVPQSPTLVTFPISAPSQPNKFYSVSHAWHCIKKQLKKHLQKNFNFLNPQTKESVKPLSFISQADMDAVMGKKAHKAAGYHRRRPLDALWLLVHTDGKQPDMEVALPLDMSTPLHHDSQFDEVWVTVYPKTLSYKVTAAYAVKQGVAA